jgi:cyclin-dependent kinase 8/11
MLLTIYVKVDEIYELIEEGLASTVSRTWTALEEDGEARWVAVKTATINRRFAKEPHDIVKELRVLCSLSHINVGFLIAGIPCRARVQSNNAARR